MAKAKTPRSHNVITASKAIIAIIRDYYERTQTTLNDVPLVDPVVLITPDKVAAGERQEIDHLLLVDGPIVCLSFADIATVETVTDRDLFLVFFNEAQSERQASALALLVMLLGKAQKHGVDSAFMSDAMAQGSAIMLEAAYYFKYR